VIATNYDVIRNVNILLDGTGDMLVHLTGDKEVKLKTQDYEQYWTPE
jgi:hypothetical protein